MTFFEKPTIPYVDMCKYIDETVYTDRFDEALTFEYLYHLCFALAKKHSYFTSNATYEDFSVFAAGIYFRRLTNPRQFEDSSAITPIKSILNYVKQSLYGYKCQFISSYVYDGIPRKKEVIEEELTPIRHRMHKLVDELVQCEFSMYLTDVCKVIRRFLSDIPYKSDPIMWNNIYISCLLSVLSSITLKRSVVERITNFKRPTSLTDSLVEELYLDEKYGSTILYHLDKSMEPYITVLTNRIKHVIARDLSQTLAQYITVEGSTKSLILNQLEENNYERKDGT